ARLHAGHHVVLDLHVGQAGHAASHDLGGFHQALGCSHSVSSSQPNQCGVVVWVYGVWQRKVGCMTTSSPARPWAMKLGSQRPVIIHLTSRWAPPVRLSSTSWNVRLLALPFTAA